MEPRKDGDAVVDVVDVLLEDGAVLAADVMVSVAGIPLVGVRLRLLLAGMAAATERGVFEEWDRRERARAREARADAGKRADVPSVETEGDAGGDREGGD